MNAGGSCDYLLMLIFFGFPRPNLSARWYKNRWFLVALFCLIATEPKLEVGKKVKSKLSPSSGSVALTPHPYKGSIKFLKLISWQKYQGSFSALSCMEVCHYSYFWWCAYFWGPWVSLVMTDDFSASFSKIPSSIDGSWTHSLPFCFWPIFNWINYGHIINYQKDVNQITLNHTTL